jgi:DNA polymerase III sliding clamp (beta) subunit (PCNA family)
MLKELKFVQGAISRKDLVPAMKHFAIENGFVRSYNGVIALCSPIAFDINCYPKADTLIKAISNCDDTVTLTLTPAGKLSVKSGVFRALIQCVEKSEVHLEPSGDIVQCDGDVLLQAFKKLEPFVGEDASRPWANGILLRGQSAFATCNVILCEYWTGISFPHVVNIPHAAVKEVVRIGEAPSHLQLDDKSVTFHYSDGRWIRSQLFATDWPDLSKVLDRPCNAVDVDERIFSSLDKLKAFVDKSGRVIYTAGKVATHDDEEEGGHVEIPGSTMQGIYALDMISLLKGVAKQADFTTYPSPCLFFGDNLRGAIVGRKM